MRVVIEGIVAGTGTGYSKKESQQKAAKEALMKLRREPKFLDSIFRAKEKRTAMGAEEFSVLPKIEEIEEEIAKLEQRTPECRTERPVKKRTRRAAREAQLNNEAQQAESTEKPNANTPEKAETEKKKPTPRKKKANPGAKQAEVPTEKPLQTTETSEKPAQMPQSKKPQRKTTAKSRLHVRTAGSALVKTLKRLMKTAKRHAKKSSVLPKKPLSIKHKCPNTPTVRKHTSQVFAHRWCFSKVLPSVNAP